MSILVIRSNHSDANRWKATYGSMCVVLFSDNNTVLSETIKLALTIQGISWLQVLQLFR